MINRVLIRIKVIQMLYSYLLTEKMFMLESQPTPPTKEKRFAYKLYLDLLTMMVDISNSVEVKKYLPLKDNRFIRIIMNDEKIKSNLVRNSIEPYPYSSLISILTDQIKESAILKNYLKSADKGMSQDLKVWQEIFSLIIIPNKELNDLIGQQENFSARGVERMREMMNTTFLNFSMSQDNIFDAIKTLRSSFDKSYELYFWLLLLPIELTNLREQQIDLNKHKFLPSEEDLNPNLRFVENKFVEILRSNEIFIDFINKNKLSWHSENRILLNSLLKNIIDSEIYDEYMNAEVNDLNADCEFWRNIFKTIIFGNTDLEESLEEKSVFWNDDIDIVGTFVLKTIKKVESETKDFILAKYKDEEDARFGEELFQYVIKNKDEYKSYINEFVKKESWDSERLAFMDVILIITTLAEILNFHKIPVNVSLNEYIEIAKYYSTPKSSLFINGILGAIIAKLRADKILLKE